MQVKPIKQQQWTKYKLLSNLKANNLTFYCQLICHEQRENSDSNRTLCRIKHRAFWETPINLSITD